MGNARSGPGRNVDLARLSDQHRVMARIRAFEETALAAAAAGLVTGAIHPCIGQEAVAAGICANLGRADYLFATHRGHGHTLAKGADPAAMMCEIFGRAGGLCGGKGGSMHIADFGVGLLGANGVVAASVPLAVGAALTSKLKKLGRVAVAFFGDGAANQGVLHESMNLASVWKLPVIFCCENNGYAESTPTEYGLSVANVADRAAGYDMPGVIVDGMDVFAVYEAAGQAVARARAGQGPTLLEAMTYRFYGHTVFDNPLTYRTKEEEDSWRARDPLKQFRERVLPEGEITVEELDRLDQDAEDLMEEAIRFADESPMPEPAQLYADVYVDYPLDMLKRGVNMEI